MAELLVRFGSVDAALAVNVLTGPRSRRPSRVVVDAHVAAATPTIAAGAARAGIPMLVDPQTFFLQDDVNPANAWARLPFAVASRLSPADVAEPRRAAAIAEQVIDYQLGHGASHVMVPYVHVERAGDGWDIAQLALWEASRRVLDAAGLDMPVVATLALGWRLLAHTAWPSGLLPLTAALNDLGPDEIALAATKVDAGVCPEDRLADMLAAIERLARDFPVLAWQQGALGEAAVLAGARGYETGIGWRERCDLQSKMRSLRSAPTDGGGPRPIYITSLRRGIDKRTLQEVLGNPRLEAGAVCLDVTCCPDGPRSLLADARQHAINARLASLAQVVTPAHSAWRWAQLAAEAEEGLDWARRINRHLRMAGSAVPTIPTAALQATHLVADRRRAYRRRHPAA